MKHIKQIILTFVACASLLIMPALVVSSVAYAATTPDSQAKTDICGGAGVFGGDSGCGDNGAAVGQALNVVINLLSVAVGVAAVVMIIVAGLNFITAGGDSGKIKTAQTSIVYAVIGLIVVVFAQVIVHFVLSKF